MTLLITAFAAEISTIIWYIKADANMRMGTLCLMFWGASLMWLVDAVVEYIEAGAEYFTPPASDMLNDAYLGLSVVALGIVIWLISLLLKDPRGVIAKIIKNNK